MKRMRAAAVAASVLVPTAPLAFGTVHGLGQNAEHERITRHALECAHERSGEACFEPGVLDLLAGRRGTFGAVGAPDDPRRGLMSEAGAHCDNGDWLHLPGYPHGRQDAEDALTGCRDLMAANLDAAVQAAGELVDAGGRVRLEQATGDCRFERADAGNARCRALAAFGLTLHAAQDFYSHTNWTDDRRAAGTTADPPGLGNTGPAPFIGLRTSGPLPASLISGCYEGFPEALHCRGRVPHARLNKDTGAIDPAIGAGTTPRGRVNGNFARAAAAAIADTADKWLLLRQRVRTRYGRSGPTIICALRSDDPGACR